MYHSYAGGIRFRKQAVCVYAGAAGVALITAAILDFNRTASIKEENLPVNENTIYTRSEVDSDDFEPVNLGKNVIYDRGTNTLSCQP